MRITAAAVHRLAEESIIRRTSNRKTRTLRDRFVAHFGVSPRVVAAIWNRLDDKDLLPWDMETKHLLWCLLFLKQYSQQRCMAPWCGTDEKTYRKWVWIVLDVLGEMDLVRQCVRDLSSRSVMFVRTSLRKLLINSSFPYSSSTTTTDQVEEPVQERQGLYCFDYYWWYWFQDLWTNSIQQQVVVSQDKPCWPPVWNWYLHSNWLDCVGEWSLSCWRLPRSGNQ